MKKKLRRQALNSALLLFFIGGFTACTSPKASDLKRRLDLTFFEITIDSIPGRNVQVVENDQGRAGMLYISDIDTVFFNVGYDIENLSEKDPAVIFLPNLPPHDQLDTSLIDPKNLIFTDKQNFDIDDYRKQNVYFDSIHGARAKLTVPRSIAKGGITGVYFDSIRSGEGGRLKFNLFARDLDSTRQSRLLGVIQTIKFK